ncbi:hypothetical protein [Paraburkholderia sp. XV]|uniref:hypothetical protein n=1 Tax=Paraburkholderia sp. XV TaxID=2831520 RepID=UPI001CD36288|nr:hypothetical protein [Paraburkholderia sp. XV]
MPTSYTRGDASNAAVEIVKAGLQSGAIKLNGSLGTPEQGAKDDAVYLSTLINEIVEKIKNPDLR